MPGLVLQPVDQAVELVLAQALSCWARTVSGGVDPLVRYDTSCASPTGGALGRFVVSAAACGRYGPLPVTSGGAPIPCEAEASGWVPYVVTAADVAAVDPNSCGSSPVPVTTSIAWEPDPAVMTAVAATVTVSGAGRGHAVMIDWGDGSPPEQAVAGHAVVHDYGGAGDYEVRAWPLHHPGGPGSVAVGVKTHAPVVYVYSDPDDDWRALLWVDEPANGTVYAIEWGDGSGEVIQRNPPPYPRVPHDYAQTGIYTASVTDTRTKRVSDVVFEAGGMGVLFTFPADDATPFIVVTRMKVGATWELDWGDGTAVQTGTVPVNASLRRSHTTALAGGTYTVVAREIVDGAVRRTVVRELIIPSVFSLQMNVSMSWRQDGGDPRTISVTPTETPPQVDCTVDWGDGSAVETVAGGATIAHTYTQIPAEGYMIAVEETGGQGRRFHRLIGEPVHIGVPHLSAWADWSAEIIIRGIPGLSNADWYGIDWGDGNNQLFAAVGAEWNAWHRYNAPGTYTLKVDAPGMEAPVLRSMVVPTYPQPSLTAAEDTADPSRMSALVTVDNTECGGDVELYWGDGTSEIAGEAATVSHQWAEAATHTVIARCLADPTARGRVNVTVPYGAEQTLAARVVHDPGSDLYTARAIVTAYAEGKPVLISWGDGDSESFQPPTEPVHAYAFDSDYTVVIAYVDNTESVTIPITIPFEGA